jgi:chaperonin GroES
MKLRPLNDWAVIRPFEAEEVTAGGLYIPDTAKDKPHEGVVEAIGPGAYEEEKYGKKKKEKKERRFIPTTIKPGDQVLYEQYAGQTYKINGEDRILVRERDILGILLERSSRLGASPRPLQIPAATSTAGSTALVKQGAGAKAASRTKEKGAKGKKTAVKKGSGVKGRGASVKKKTTKKTGKKKRG